MSLEYQISVCVCVYKCIYMYMCVFVYFEVRKSKAKAKALRNLRFVISFLNYSNIFPLSWPLFFTISPHCNPSSTPLLEFWFGR